MKTFNKIAFLILVISSMSFTQSGLIDIPITVTDNSGGTATMHFGLDPNATDGIDNALGESELPPAPPSGVFDARFIGTDIGLSGLGQGSSIDYRQGNSNYNGTKVHELQYQVGSGTEITISWNLPSGINGQLQDLITGNFINQSMIDSGNITIDNPGAINKLKMTITYNLNPTLKIISPNGGENWIVGTLQPIKWNYSGVFDSVKIEYTTDNGLSWIVISQSTKNDGQLNNWKIPNTPSMSCKIRISHDIDENPEDESDNIFFIVPLSAPILNFPLETDTVRDSTVTFNWSDVNGASSYNLQVAEDSNFTTVEVNQDSIANSQILISKKIFRDNVTYFWRVNASNDLDTSDWSTVHSFAEVISSIKNINNPIPNEYKLSQNYPNPFNPSTKIQYSILQTQFVTIKVFDILGREVKTLINEEKSPGNYDVNFSAKGLASGLYFYRIQAGDFIQTRKMILLK